MKKNIFIVPIISFIAGIILYPLALQIIIWIVGASTPSGEAIETSKYSYALCAVSIIFIIIVGIILRKSNFDKMTIFKSATILTIYIIIIYAASGIYTSVAGEEVSITVVMWLQTRMNYPFRIFETIGNALRLIIPNQNQILIGIVVVLSPYILVPFGISNEK